MGSSPLPDLIDFLVDGITALNIGPTYDGYPILDELAPLVIWVGVDNPDPASVGESGSAQQDPATLGTNRSREERGEIVCAVHASSGDDDARAARHAARDAMQAIEAWVRTLPYPNSPVPTNVYVIGFGASIQLIQEQTNAGATALLVFRIAYRART